MTLSKEQVNRYSRHIIIPEISGPGVKRLLESSVLICGKNVADITPAVYYLAASGVGSICCHFDDAEGFDKLATGIHDLNSDVSIDLSDDRKGEVKVFLGRPEFLVKKRQMILTGFKPSLIALFNGWKGGTAIFKDEEKVKPFVAKLSDRQTSSGVDTYANGIDGDIFSTCLLGALAALEVIKLLLGIGETVEGFQYFNLLTLKFLRVNQQEELEEALNEMYLREQTDSREFKLQDSRVLVVGTGGLGSPAAFALALAGVGMIGLVDYDTVEISNLNRQILHTTSRIGMPKAESAAITIKSLNPFVNTKAHQLSLNKENVFDIIEDYDVIIAAVDNFPTRFLLNDACFLAGKPLIDAGVLRFDGTCMTMMPGSPCYRCFLPNPPLLGNVPSCSETGVLGPVPGLLGFIQAAEAVKLISDCGNILNGRIIFFNGLSSDFHIIKLSRNSACPLCGANPTIYELQEYETICRDTVNDDNNHQKTER